jgi:hypothetical protein
VGEMRIPYPRWWLTLLRPLNNRYTWRLRLRILTAFDPPWLTRHKP